MSDFPIQKVFSNSWAAYAAVHNPSSVQERAALSIISCKTGVLGQNFSRCTECGYLAVRNNSCKNRHCPMCQGMDVDEWIDLRREDVLEAPYFHVVFTIPSQLYSLTYANQRYLYDALYHAANRTLTELSADPKRFGAKIGFICSSCKPSIFF